jgi:pyrroloquinoline quinone (PQQ) biosynthesis protein C
MEYLNKVRKNVREAISATPAVTAVLKGNASPAVYKHYLSNVWHYAQHSGTVIAIAGARCVQSHPALAAYLLHHAQDELGHDVWALQDLEVMGVDADEVRASRPLPACAAMIGYEYYLAAHANPVSLFGWLFVLEAMGDDLGHVVARRVREALNAAEGVKFLAGHGEADEEHTKEIIDQIRTNIPAADMPDVHHVADVIGSLYVRLFQEIGEAAR